MSLNFVSSAVLTSTDGVSHNEEKAVESNEANSVRQQQEVGSHKPLFEQLRTNADRAQEERDAAAKAMRGTRTLDEEDCAHLESIERQRMDRDAAVRRGVEDEVAAFRAARAERMAEGSTELLEDKEGGDVRGAAVDRNLACTKPPLDAVRADEASAPSLAMLAPKFVIKTKKRRRQPNGQALGSGASASGTTAIDSDGEDTASKLQKDTKKGEQKETKDGSTGDEKEGAGGLGALLGGYGSDSESE